MILYHDQNVYLLVLDIIYLDIFARVVFNSIHLLSFAINYLTTINL